MKIVHLVGWYFPESIGGSEVYVAGLAKRLQALGHSVSVAAPLAGAATAQTYNHDGVECFRYPIPPHPTRDEAQGRVMVRGVELLQEHLEREKPDIAHFHSVTTGLGLDEMQFAKSIGAHAIFTSHLPALGSLCQRGTLMRWGESLCDGYAAPVKCGACMLQQRGFPKPAAWTLGWLGAIPGMKSIRLRGRVGTALQMTNFIRFRLRFQAQLVGVVERFILLNRWAYDVMLANGAPASKLAINYLGHSAIDPVRKPGPVAKPTRLPMLIGYVGRLAEGKGINQMLAAIGALPADAPLRFEFRGAVNNSAGRAIANRIASIAAKRPNVTLAPPVSPDQIINVMREYDVLCVPSVAYENGPTVVSEALAAGTPVIGSRIGAMPDSIESGVDGLLVSPGDVPELTRAFEAVARDPLGTVDYWRSNLPDARTMTEIANDYEALYRYLMSADGIDRKAI